MTPHDSPTLAMMGWNELILPLFPLLWIVAPIVVYALIRKRQNRRPSALWMLLMVPFGWLAFLIAILSGS